MKTIKISETTHTLLMTTKVNTKIDHHINLKTLDDAIQYLFECYLEIRPTEEAIVIEKAKELFNGE